MPVIASDSPTTSSTSSPNFTSIYFDTNILVGQGWPRISAALQRLLSLCKSLNVAGYIPQVVEIELENGWMKDFKSTCEDVRSSIRAYTGYHEILNLQQTELPMLADPSKARAEYREHVSRLNKDWSIGIVPLPSVALADLVRMASLREIAFGEKGAGFQDSLVFLSVLEHMRGTNAVGALLSNDGIFDRRRAELALLSKKNSCEIVLFRNVEEISQALELRETSKTQDLIKKDEERAFQAVRAGIKTLRRWLNDQLEALQLRGSFDWSSDVFQVSRINSLQVISVATPFPLERREGQNVDITIRVGADARVILVDSPVSRIANSILAGRAVVRYRLAEQQLPAAGYLPIDAELTRPVEIEIEATTALVP
jgi:hypothetical protein